MSSIKSPVLRKYEKKLIEVNDQLCYFLFSDAELELNITKLKKTENLFTTDIFCENKFSSRLHVKIDDIPLHRKKAFNTLVGIIHIASVEYLLNYIEEIESYHSLVYPTAFDSISNEKPEEQLLQKIQSWSKNIEIEIIKTIKYLRLRRNHVTHLSEDLNDALKSIIKNESNQLNKFWKNMPTQLYDFCFTNQECSTFTVNEIFALVNLVRVCMRKVDEVITFGIEYNKIAKYEFNLLKSGKLNLNNNSKNLRKFNTLLKNKYGVKFNIKEDEYLSFFNN